MKKDDMPMLIAAAMAYARTDGGAAQEALLRVSSELEVLRGASAKPCADCGGTGNITKGLQGWLLPCASCASCATPQQQQPSAPASSPWVSVESGVMPEDDVPIWVIVARRPLPVASERDGNWIDITGGYWLEQVPLDDLLYWRPRNVEPTPAPPSDGADGREP